MKTQMAMAPSIGLFPSKFYKQNILTCENPRSITQQISFTILNHSCKQIGSWHLNTWLPSPLNSTTFLYFWQSTSLPLRPPPRANSIPTPQALTSLVPCSCFIIGDLPSSVVTLLTFATHIGRFFITLYYTDHWFLDHSCHSSLFTAYEICPFSPKSSSKFIGSGQARGEEEYTLRFTLSGWLLVCLAN